MMMMMMNLLSLETKNIHSFAIMSKFQKFVEDRTMSFCPLSNATKVKMSRTQRNR